MKNWKSKLSPRELSIIELVKLDLTNKQIGDKLGISEHTVVMHKANIYNKLQIPTQNESLKAICS